MLYVLLTVLMAEVNNVWRMFGPKVLDSQTSNFHWFEFVVVLIPILAATSGWILRSGLLSMGFVLTVSTASGAVVGIVIGAPIVPVVWYVLAGFSYSLGRLSSTISWDIWDKTRSLTVCLSDSRHDLKDFYQAIDYLTDESKYWMSRIMTSVLFMNTGGLLSISVVIAGITQGATLAGESNSTIVVFAGSAAIAMFTTILWGLIFSYPLIRSMADLRQLRSRQWLAA